MTDGEEKAYMQGGRAAWQRLLDLALKELGYEGGNLGPAALLISERESAIATLRDVCGAHGDNDWETTLHLSDIIDKHLARHLG